MAWSFSEHGKLHAYVDDNILVVEGEGPWNSEQLEKTTRDARSTLEALYGKPWGVMTVMRGDAVYIPEAAESLVKLIRREKHKGRQCTAIVLKDCAKPVFCRQHLSAIYTEAEENFAFFETEDEAKSWLTEHIHSA
ncbi:hypothetical protein [Aestuariibacter salexigens]|uniref:hypothetical protein n=1 Tax=Aestuariibacter salexigens TaxID=226010 RepID=UPI0003F7BCF1|nr:hypothetical protein [Aestuariibacter salexigens]